MDAEAAHQEIVERGGRVSDAMRAFRTFLGHSDIMAAPNRASSRAEGDGLDLSSPNPTARNPPAEF
jgi:hypothetical protein